MTADQQPVPAKNEGGILSCFLSLGFHSSRFKAVDDSEDVRLEKLNVFIGRKGSGKSYCIWGPTCARVRLQG